MSHTKTNPPAGQAASDGARRLHAPLTEMSVGAMLFIAASLSFWMTRSANGIALFWPGTAMAAALLIRLPRVRWKTAVVSVLLALVLANVLVGHRPWGTAAILAGINGAEIALMVAVFRAILVFPYPNISIGQATVMTALFGIAIPGLAAAAMGFMLHGRFAVSFVQGALQWWSSHAIGACLAAPPILLFSLQELGRLTRKRFLVENTVTFIVGLAACYLVIRYVRFPFVSMGLILLIVSFRLGGFGTSVMSLAFGLLITQLWLLGIRPVGLDPTTITSSSLIGLPVIALLATVMPPIAVGLGSDARRVAVRALRESEERYRVTLDSIGDAVITTNQDGLVQWLNPVAESMTGWRKSEARSKPLADVFKIVDAASRQPTLISRTGTEFGIEDSTAPIRNAEGKTVGAVLVFHDVTEQRRLSREISHRAAHDALTGLVNRAEFEARLSRLLAALTRPGSGHVLLYIDLDEFKVVNDACGHAAGDQLLRQVSALLQSAARGRDTVARLGGDEFAVLLEDCDVEHGRMIAQRICDQMEVFRFAHDGLRYRIGTSIGVVPVDLRWGSSAALMQAADSCCFAAKDAGRNRVHLWVESDAALEVRQGKMRWLDRLEAALAHDRFALCAQRIEPIDGPDERLHCEVLLRLVDDDGGLISPGAFLPAAERFHLAARIDRWVVQRAFAHLEDADTEIDRIDTIAINLSGQSIGDRAFRRDLVRMLEASTLRRRLCFEIAECAAITDLANATAFIEEIRAVGSRVAIDDFGAGASSFGYLRSLSLDYIKIDGQFVTGVLEDPLDNAALRCFCEVAKAVGVKTVAKFVERAEIRDALRGMGVDLVQGHLIHRPAPLAQLIPRKSAAATMA